MANELVPVQAIKQSVCIPEVGVSIEEFQRTIGERDVRTILSRMSHEAESNNAASKKELLNEAYFSVTTLLEELKRAAEGVRRGEDRLIYGEVAQLIKTHIPERFWAEKFAASNIRVYRVEPKKQNSEEYEWRKTSGKLVRVQAFDALEKPSREIYRRFKVRFGRKVFVARMLEVDAAAAHWILFELQRLEELKGAPMVLKREVERGEWVLRWYKDRARLQQLAQLITAMAERKQANAVTMEEYCDEWAKRLMKDVREGNLKPDGTSYQTEVTAYEWLLDRRQRKEREKEAKEAKGGGR